MTRTPTTLTWHTDHTEGTTTMRLHRGRTRLAGLLTLCLLTAACSGGGDSEEPASSEGGSEGGSAAAETVTDTIAVGSTNFTEQEIVAEMYALALEDADYDVERRFQLGAREVVLPALQGGDIDVYPEYVGTALEFLNGGAGEATADTAQRLGGLRENFAESDVEVLEPAEAQDKNGLVVTPETSEELGATAVSDLSGDAADLTLGGPPECPQRPLCLPGYEETYGLEFGEFASLDAGGPLTIEALASGDVDVALMFTTQGVIDERDWVLLEDDEGLQPAENIAPAIRADSLDPQIRETLDGVSAVLTTEQMTTLNRRVDVDEEPVAQVAEEFLTEQGVLGG